MKKYLLAALPALALSCSVSAITDEQEAKVPDMREQVKDLSKAEVRTKHIKLFEAVRADPTQKNCDAFVVFDAAGRNEKKIELLDFEANNRSIDGKDICRGKGFYY